MDRRAQPLGPQPHVPLDVPRSPHNFHPGPPRQQQADGEFVYESLFEVMGIVEKGQNYLDILVPNPPKFGLDFLIKQRTETIEYLKANKASINEVLGKIGGLPVRLAQDDGTVLEGHLTTFSDLRSGRWNLTLKNSTFKDGMPVSRTTSEIRAGFLAATTAETTLPDEDTQQPLTQLDPLADTASEHIAHLD